MKCGNEEQEEHLVKASDTAERYNKKTTVSLVNAKPVKMQMSQVMSEL